MPAGIEQEKGDKLKSIRPLPCSPRDEITPAMYVPMTAEKARRAWFKLPAYAKAFIDYEDVLQDALAHVCSYVIPRYDPRRAAWSTYLYTALDNHLANFAASFRCTKRTPPPDFQQATSFMPADVAASTLAFCRAFIHASENVRFVLANLVFRPHSLSRHLTDGPLREIRALSCKFKLSAGDISILRRTPECWMRMVDMLPETCKVTANNVLREANHECASNRGRAKGVRVRGKRAMRVCFA